MATKNEAAAGEVLLLKLPTLAHASLVPRDTASFPVIAEYRVVIEGDGSRSLFRRERSMHSLKSTPPLIDWQLLAHGLKEVNFTFTAADGTTLDTWPPPTVTTKEHEFPFPVRIGYTLIFQKPRDGRPRIFHSASAIEADSQ